ncbi:isochorismate synthase MenF [Conexibacter sp. S30A1]|uniref:isochorismate synthase n=1 Tax=Conexibacter sp. S30A1 TaxID=2937800 RepID=UPI00200D0311|nr:isochorismate synthase [Conexibacter sp. S30A1]
MAIALSSRAGHERWYVLEQPARVSTAHAGLGAALRLDAEGPERFRELERRWMALAERALSDAGGDPPGSGLVAYAGFAFAEDGGSSPAWQGFGPGSLTVPAVWFARRGQSTWITCNVAVHSRDADPDAVLSEVQDLLTGLREQPLPMLDPAPVGRFTVHSPMPPAHYEEAVRSAVRRIRAGELQKIVLAREVQVQAPVAHDPAAVLDVLRHGFPECFVYAAGRGDATFIGATPELLVRREGMRASTVALAGSTRRSSDPAVDDHLGESLLRSDKNRHENLLVAERIARQLKPYAVWVTTAPEPVLVRVANIQHLAAPIRAQLRRPVGVLTLAGALHPTPAVGGEPGIAAQRLIPALEGLDRGWYAGALGWTDTAGDGEFCVTLRCALLRGRDASCYAGCGIVADSDPAAELEETEIKLQALLPVLSG